MILQLSLYNNAPKWKNPLHSDPVERKIQKESREFLEGKLPYISTLVLLRLKEIQCIKQDSFDIYILTMPTLAHPTEEQKKTIKTFHENLKPYLQQFAEGKLVM